MTDKTYGTSTHEAYGEVRTTSYDQGTTRHGMDPGGSNMGGELTQVNVGATLPEGQCVVEGGMVTSIAVAEAAGMPYHIPGREVTSPTHDQTPGKAPAAEVEPGVSQALADAANAQLTTILETLDPGAMTAVVAQAVKEDEEALAAIGGAESPLVQSYVIRGETWASEAGAPNNIMSDYLSNDDKEAARMAVVGGDRMTFDRFAAKAASQAQEFAAIHQDVLNAGFEVDNGGVYNADGEYEGNLVDLIANNEIYE